jgi:anaerobic selenocysteine-containing dehydrogenase
VQVSNQAIEARGEAKSNTDLFRELAMRMGFADECFNEDVDQMIDQALAADNGKLDPGGWFAGITRERLEQEGHAHLNFGSEPFLPFAQGGFTTASGKAELYSEALAAQGLDPVASFIPPTESRHSENARRFPLELLARKADNYLNSSFCNVPSLQKMEQPELLEINSQDAMPRGIKEGDWVRVFNSRGEVRLRAHVNGTVQRGVVAARLNWARLAPDGKSINALTSETLTDIGAGPTFYSCLVEVEAAQVA